LLKQQAISVISKSKNALSNFRQEVDKKRNATEAQHKKEIESLKSGIEQFEEKRQEKYDVFVEGESEALLQEFESGDGTEKKSEEDMLRKFCDGVNSKIEEVKTRKTEISHDFEEWKKQEHLSNRARISWVSHTDDLPLESEDLENDSYQACLDLHAYMTSNSFWDIVLTLGAFGSAGLGR